MGEEGRKNDGVEGACLLGLGLGLGPEWAGTLPYETHSFMKVPVPRKRLRLTLVGEY